MVGKHDFANIISIPISVEDKANSLVWHFTPKGNYEVQSGYHLAINEQRCVMILLRHRRLNHLMNFGNLFGPLTSSPNCVISGGECAAISWLQKKIFIGVGVRPLSIVLLAMVRWSQLSISYFTAVGHGQSGLGAILVESLLTVNLRRLLSGHFL